MENFAGSGAVRFPVSPQKNILRSSSSASIGLSDEAIQPVIVSYGLALDRRLSYYRTLSGSGPGASLLEPPPAVLQAATAALLIWVKPGSQASSASIIFTLWTTMMGSTLLVLPYCFHLVGWLLGAVIALACAGVSQRTSMIIIKHGMELKSQSAEFADLAEVYLGRAGWNTALTTSVFVLLGAATAMHQYLSSSLLQLIEDGTKEGGLGMKEGLEAIFGVGSASSTGVTLVVLVAILPLASLPTMRLLARFNMLGVVCIVIILIFAVVSAAVAGVSPKALELDELAKPASIGIVLGIFSLSFFIQNCALTIMRAAAVPKDNQRNLTVAFVLVYLTYTGFGVLGNICPPLGNGLALGLPGKGGGKDSFLGLTQPESIAPMLVLARFAVVMQCVTVLPVLVYIIRAQLFTAFYFKNPYPGLLPVVCINVVTLACTSAVCISGVHISDVLRFTGAFAAFVCVYAVPACVQWQQETPSRLRRGVIAAVLFGIGTGGVVMQFFAT